MKTTKNNILIQRIKNKEKSDGGIIFAYAKEYNIGKVIYIPPADIVDFNIGDYVMFYRYSQLTALKDKETGIEYMIVPKDMIFAIIEDVKNEEELKGIIIDSNVCV